MLGPFNNGANHAATADRFRSAVAWAIENPWGSGLRQLFPKATPFYRPQESVTGYELAWRPAEEMAGHIASFQPADRWQLVVRHQSPRRE